MSSEIKHLSDWLKTARKGERFEYHVGCLGRDQIDPRSLARRKVDILQDELAAGRVVLVQQPGKRAHSTEHGPVRDFHYFAIRTGKAQP
jgi:hypothetical protein